MYIVFFQAEDGIRDLVRSRGLGDVYKRQGQPLAKIAARCMAGQKLNTQKSPDGKAPREVVPLSLIHI